jgi:chromosome segregation ATPase
MLKHLTILPVLSLLAWTSLATEPAAATLEQVNSRIHAIEAALIKAQADRYRQKHELEYGDDALTPMRIEAKKLEKQLLEVRKAYNDRLRVLDEGIRTSESTIAATHKEITELGQLVEAIQREVQFAGDAGDATVKARLPDLETEVTQTEDQIMEKQANVKEAMQQLEERKKEVASGDQEAKAMLDEITALEAQYKASFGQLNTATDNSDAIKALDDQRQGLAAELQQLQEQKLKLLKTTTKTP